MKIKVSIIIIILLSFTLLISGCSKQPSNKAQTSKYAPLGVATPLGAARFKKIIINSEVLHKAMKANIYLPDGYNKKTKYPVLYIIHGDNGSENFCMPGLKIEKTADRLIKLNLIKPLIIVSPEMDNSLGLNSSKDYIEYKMPKRTIQLGRYEDYFSKELLLYIDTHYSTINNRNGRYIGGMSTGAYIAFRTAFRHPNEFSKVGGHSPDFAQKLPTKQMEKLYFPDKQAKLAGSIFYLAQKNPILQLNIYLDCGKSDIYKFYIDCNKLNKLLISRGIKSQYHLNPGTHSSVYWISNMEKYLLFYNGKI
jgi:enterochelin esterase-like enzyme